MHIFSSMPKTERPKDQKTIKASLLLLLLIIIHHDQTENPSSITTPPLPSLHLPLPKKGKKRKTTAANTQCPTPLRTPSSAQRARLHLGRKKKKKKTRNYGFTGSHDHPVLRWVGRCRFEFLTSVLSDVSQGALRRPGGFAMCMSCPQPCMTHFVWSHRHLPVALGWHKASLSSP